jgi:hypothetical protein
LLLQTVGLGFLSFLGTFDVPTDTHLIVQEGFLGVSNPHSEKGLERVFFPSDDGDLLAVVFNLGQDVLELIL